MILFVAATLKEMEHFIRGSLSQAVLHDTGSLLTYRNVDISFLVCGIGPLNAAISLEAYLSGNASVECVVNVGIAGSYDLKNLHLGSVCVANAEIWPEYGVRTNQYFADTRELGFPLYQKGGKTVWNTLTFDPVSTARNIGLNLPTQWAPAIGITLAGVSSGTAQARALQSSFKADMENMEGFSLGYCCYLRSVPFLEIRAISNLAGSRNKADWDFNKAFSALTAAWPGLWEQKS